MSMASRKKSANGEMGRAKMNIGILQIIFFPIGIANLLIWSIKRLIVTFDSISYRSNLESDCERIEFTLDNKLGGEFHSYLSEGAKVIIEYSGNVYSVRSGNDWIGCLNRNDNSLYEKFAPAVCYIKNTEIVDDNISVTIIGFR